MAKDNNVVGNTIERDVVDSYRENMVKYSIETNRRRAFVDVKDGLKLVQRRIIDVMYNDIPSNNKGKKFTKTSNVIGRTMAKSHPHGDSSMQEVIKLLSNWFDTKEPLLNSESNMGNMQGGREAAPRYTEVRMSSFGLEAVVADLAYSTKVVDYLPTFDNSDIEPEYLPVAVPLLLINGTYGIGTGKMASIPSHNLAEVIDATINLIKNPKAQVVLVPDFCMPCEIVDNNWKSISNKGEGKFVARGIITVEQDRGQDIVVIKSTPYQVSLDKGDDKASKAGGVKYKILDFIKNGELPQIDKIEEDSKGDTMRMVLRLKKGADANFVRDMIYRKTDMQKSYPVNFEVVNGVEMLRMSYKSYLENFIEMRKTVKFRLHCIELQKAQTEYDRNEPYVRLAKSGHIDEVIDLIRKQKTRDDSKLIESIIRKIKCTDMQARRIVDTPLKQLGPAYINDYQTKLDEAVKKIEFHKNKIIDENSILEDIIAELVDIKAKYGKPRVCKIIKEQDINNIPRGDFTLVFTENNYVKKLTPGERVVTYRGDAPKHVIDVDNAEDVLIFTAQGKVFKLPVSKVPITEKGSNGSDVRLLIRGMMSDIIKIIYLPTLKDIANKKAKHYVVTVSVGNCIKKMEIADFLTVQPSGTMYTRLNAGDSIKEVVVAPDALDLVLYSGRKALRFNMKQIGVLKRSAIGSKAMVRGPIDGMSVLYPDCTDVLVLTQSGKVNRFNVGGLVTSQRGRAGSSVIKLDKTDSIRSIYGVNNNCILNVQSRDTKLEIPVADIEAGSSVGGGKKLLSAKTDFVTRDSISLIK